MYVVEMKLRPCKLAIRLAAFAICLCASLAAAQTGPPKEANKKEADLIELTKLDKTIKLDIRYATADNFVGKPVYPEARAFLQRPAAERVVRVHQLLKKEGRGLVIYDGYRPWSITKLFWEVVREDQKKFVADPAQGSKHNRGCAVDLGIYDLKTGKAIPMPSRYDEFTERASPDYKGGTDEERANRDKLRRLMEAEGFTVNPNEWWHFDLNGWQDYAIYDLAFDEIRNLDDLKKFVVRRIEISGNTYVKDRDIRDRIQLHEGDIFDEKNVLESVKSINRMGLFDEITDQAFSYYVDKPKRDIDFVIHLKEKPKKR
jgi:D-alanyl-D-alanine dipeptidase